MPLRFRPPVIIMSSFTYNGLHSIRRSACPKRSPSLATATPEICKDCWQLGAATVTSGVWEHDASLISQSLIATPVGCKGFQRTCRSRQQQPVLRNISSCI